MTFEELRQMARDGDYLKDNVDFYSPQAGADRVTTYIDMIKYGATSSAGRCIKKDYLEAFRALSLGEKAEISLLDDQNILAAATISEMMAQGYDHYLGGNDSVVSEMATAIAIVLGNTSILKDASHQLLYRYFVNSRIPQEELVNFTDEGFISWLLEKLLREERVIFTWIIQNIILMIRCSLLVPSRHKDFFREIFERNKYIQGEHEVLLIEAISREPLIFDEISTVRLSIDPFTRQVNYSLWLQDSAKFIFMGKLRAINGVDVAKSSSEYDKKIEIFNRIYKYERSLLRYERKSA